MNNQHNKGVSSNMSETGAASYFVFLSRLRTYLEEGARDPIPLRPFLNDLAPNLPAEERLTDRKLINALRFYPVEAWWPVTWGDRQFSAGMFIHDGRHLDDEAEIHLEQLLEKLELSIDTLTVLGMDNSLSNDSFDQLRRMLAREWIAKPDEREHLEEEYRKVRLLAATRPVLSHYEMQKLASDFRLLSLRVVRQALYQSASDRKHLVHPGGDLVVCERCGLRVPEDSPCTQQRCPGEEGWQRVPFTDDLLILHPVHMERIMVPAIEELKLFNQIKSFVQPRDGTAILWPAIDRFDIYVVTPRHRIALDVKDWEHPEALARHIHSDIQRLDPYLYDIGAYVYPAERGGDFGRVVRERTQARLGDNRILSTSSVMDLIRKDFA